MDGELKRSFAAEPVLRKGICELLSHCLNSLFEEKRPLGQWEHFVIFELTPHVNVIGDAQEPGKFVEQEAGSTTEKEFEAGWCWLRWL